MSELMTMEQFAPLAGQKFLIYVSDQQSVEAELVEVSALKVQGVRRGSSLRQEPFSLCFRGPRECMLGQRTYLVENASMGRVEIFLVPIGPDDIGQRYEAIFN